MSALSRKEELSVSQSHVGTYPVEVMVAKPAATPKPPEPSRANITIAEVDQKTLSSWLEKNTLPVISLSSQVAPLGTTHLDLRQLVPNDNIARIQSILYTRECVAPHIDPYLARFFEPEELLALKNQKKNCFDLAISHQQPHCFSTIGRAEGTGHLLITALTREGVQRIYTLPLEVKMLQDNELLQFSSLALSITSRLSETTTTPQPSTAKS